MGTSEKRPGSITLLLVGIVLLVAIATLFVAFAPVANCPDCVHDLNYPAPSIKTSAGIRRYRSLLTHVDKSKPCLRCNSTHRVTILNRVRHIDYECCN